MFFPSCQLDTPSLNLHQSVVLRRNARIKSSKLPPDFFYHPSPSKPISRQIGTDLSNRDIRTPSFQTRQQYAAGQTITVNERKVETARASLQKNGDFECDLLGVLRSSHKLRGLKRKQSLQVGRECNASLDQKHLRLPKILNRALIKL